MSAEWQNSVPQPGNGEFAQNLAGRHHTARLWHIVFQASTVIGIIALTALLLNIIDGAFGFVAVQNNVDPDTLSVDGVPLEELTKDQLLQILQANVSKGLFRRLESDQPFKERSRENVYQLILERVVEPEIVQTWSLQDSLFNRKSIQAEVEAKYPAAELEFVSWLDWNFARSPQSGDPEKAGVRTAILGSLWTIGITVIFAFPLGVGAAIYLEEYATDSRINRVIQTNINNLAGVPSIIYGMLGLTIFVRTLEPLSSGTLFGLADPTTANGRTILSRWKQDSPLRQ